MVTRSEAKYIRISPTKVRSVAVIIKSMNANQAAVRLDLMSQKGAYHLAKVLKSAISNAKNKGYQESKLFISKVVANSGPVLKRFRAAAFGRAATIRKRTAHILIELDTPEKLVSKPKAKK
jgi:large subunit ribosomal protein L22